ncbi:MAG: phosphotransferase [Acidimicrobiia bacterium]|nr:phosphotransferase [Acidimicrobiia bacterium]
MTIGPDARAWLARHTGIPEAGLLLERLGGATSSDLHRVRGPSDGPWFVARVHTDQAWLGREPDLAEHEAAALDEAQRTGVPAPLPVAVGGPDDGFAGPVVLMTGLGGDVVLDPTDETSWIDGLAATLAEIHDHDAAEFDWVHRSWRRGGAVEPPPWSSHPDRWAEARRVLDGSEPEERAVFLHRDFHPTNALWTGGRVSGVVDWLNACRGPAAVDVAHCRLNLALLRGPEAATAFLDAYVARRPGHRQDRYWDLDAIADLGLPDPHWYPPWTEFGVVPEPAAVLRRRLDAHLAGVLGARRRDDGLRG